MKRATGFSGQSGKALESNDAKERGGIVASRTQSKFENKGKRSVAEEVCRKSVGRPRKDTVFQPGRKLKECEEG